MPGIRDAEKTTNKHKSCNTWKCFWIIFFGFAFLFFFSFFASGVTTVRGQLEGDGWMDGTDAKIAVVIAVIIAG
jgi:hypothetical protein